MKSNKPGKEVFIVLLASMVLALAVAFSNTELLFQTFLSFVLIIGTNILAKKAVGYRLETQVETKVWSWYQFGLRKDSHFKKPLPMIWLPLLLALISRGAFWWLPILEFDVAPKTERVSRRHGLYRFTQVTEWHMGLIALWGLIANLVLAVLGYLAGYEMFARLSIYYAAWLILPLGGLDGSKILFANRGLWILALALGIIFALWGASIV